MSIAVMTLVWSKAAVRGGDLLILLALADNADDRGFAYPGIPYLAAKARMSERNAQLCLRQLESDKIIKIKPNAGPNGTNRYEIDLSFLDSLPNDFVPKRPRQGGENISPPNQNEGVKSATEVVKSDASSGEAGFTQTVIEPSEEPLSGRACAYEGRAKQAEQGAKAPDEVSKSDKAAILRAFRAFINNWPGFAGMSPAGAERTWFTLSDQDRAAAAACRDPWISLLRRQGKNHTPAPSTYLRERLWEAVEPQVDQRERTIAPPFGKAWMVHLLHLLDKPPAAPPPASAFMAKEIAAGTEKGKQWALGRQAAYGWPEVNLAFDRAQEGKGILLPAGCEDLPGMEAVDVTQARFGEWRFAFEKRGWPWPTVPPRVEFIWLPKGGPAAYFAEERSALEGEPA